MKAIPNIFLCVLLAPALSGCNAPPGTNDHFSLADRVEITELEPAANGARRYEASLAADARFTRAEHGAPLLMAFDGCDGAGFSLDFGPENWLSDRSPAKEGEKFALRFECHRELLPNHRIVEANSARPIPFPDAYPFKAAHAAPAREGERAVAVADRLLGNQLREAYTEDCGEKPLVIERIDVATEDAPRKYPAPDPAEQAHAAPGPTVHTVLGYRCLGPDGSGDA